MTQVTLSETPSTSADIAGPATPPAGEAKALRPGFIRRMGAGAWHVPAGMYFLLRRPSLWPMAALPAALGLSCVIVGAFVAWYALRPVVAALIPSRVPMPEWLGLSLVLALSVATLIAGAILGLAVALLLSAPVLDRLSRRVEALLRGRAADQSRGLRWEWAQSLKGALLFMGAAPIVFLIGLTPLVGPVAATLWGSYVLAFEQTESTLTRRGLDFAGRRAWHREWRFESLGFGLAGLILLPFVQFLVVPALTVGATRLILEIEEGITA